MFLCTTGKLYSLLYMMTELWMPGEMVVAVCHLNIMVIALYSIS